MNHTITVEQTIALANTFKYMKSNNKSIKEILFANNNMGDKQFADLLSHMIDDTQ